MDDEFHNSIITEITKTSKMKLRKRSGQITIPSPDEFSQAKLLNKNSRGIFTQALESYNRTMLLTAENDQYRVWHWDHVWQTPQSEKMMEIDCNAPSLFPNHLQN
ncbi:MAG: hypothetical protein R2827_05250 [Bdellovibrionales bacterium]